MTEWMVRRWARYGHERLYAETSAGAALGYFDVKTGCYHPDDAANLPLLERAIGSHLGGEVPNVAPAVAATPAEPGPPAWEDISSIWVSGDTFLVNGQRLPYIRNSRHEAKRAARLLTEQVGFPMPVLGVIAVLGSRKGYKVKAQPEDGAVVVVQRSRITRYAAHLPPRLTDHEADAIYEVARRSTTWR